MHGSRDSVGDCRCPSLDNWGSWRDPDDWTWKREHVTLLVTLSSQCQNYPSQSQSCFLSSLLSISTFIIYRDDCNHHLTSLFLPQTYAFLFSRLFLPGNLTIYRPLNSLTPERRTSPTRANGVAYHHSKRPIWIRWAVDPSMFSFHPYSAIPHSVI